jgi:hypothetical protein
VADSFVAKNQGPMVQVRKRHTWCLFMTSSIEGGRCWLSVELTGLAECGVSWEIPLIFHFQ